MGYMTTDEFTNDSGLLDVGDGHQIWWHDWGNKKAKTAIFHLHGGPGGGTKNKHKLSYDPAVHRVIFHDQRGNGQSLPFGGTEHNTTQDLIADMERLREKFN
jgi:proline iminopeptidase